MHKIPNDAHNAQHKFSNVFILFGDFKNEDLK